MTLKEIGQRLIKQDNRCTANPMFCVQIKVREIGYDSAYSDNTCWYDSANEVAIYDDDKDFKEPTGIDWEQFGYKDRWETVMVAFSEQGCEEFIERAHDLRRQAFRGEVRIYVQSFNRCAEMIYIRESLIKEGRLT